MRFLFLYTLLIGVIGYGQNLEQMREITSLKENFKKESVVTRPGIKPVLEQAIDPAQYILGPGDVVNVQIIGREDVNHQLMVMPEGYLLIPAVGTVDVSSLDLQSAKEKIARKLKERYVAKEALVTLVELRSFRVTVSGAVGMTGAFEVNAGMRVSDAIVLAGGFVEQAIKRQQMADQQRLRGESPQAMPPTNTMDFEEDEKEHEPKRQIVRASRRQIRIKRMNGDTLFADLMRYRLYGDLDANPYLLDGDVIVVPYAEKSAGRIEIHGAVKLPGDFEFVDGDRIEDLLLFSYGLTQDADSSGIELVRMKSPKHIERITMPLYAEKGILLDSTLDTPLHPNDRLFVHYQTNYEQKQNVKIEGQVRYPGTYALTPDLKMLSELIRHAGGFTREASLERAYIMRKSFLSEEDKELERLKSMRATEMTDMEREYFKFKSRVREGVMPVDFVALFEESDERYDATLLNGDIIIVPTVGQTIRVNGQVVNPGLYPHHSGKTMQYYIQLAGGYNWRAHKSKIRIIKSKHGEWMKGNSDAIIEEGDEIFVPQKPVRDWWEILGETVAIAYQLAAIFIFIENIRD
ncbi:hypothetical protein GF407_01535 [candidate division KSB1 bacterium]|nr:hypothetical protein [candidate division KSB1 bacterium]